MPQPPQTWRPSARAPGCVRPSATLRSEWIRPSSASSAVLGEEGRDRGRRILFAAASRHEQQARGRKEQGESHGQSRRHDDSDLCAEVHRRKPEAPCRFDGATRR